jgi:hypothetical protein
MNFKMVDRRTSERKFVAHDPKRIASRKPAEKELTTESYSKWVLVLRRVFSNDDSLRKTRLEIKSPLILKVLKDVITEETAALTVDTSITWPNDKLFGYVSIANL